MDGLSGEHEPVSLAESGSGGDIGRTREFRHEAHFDEARAKFSFGRCYDIIER